jgi:hypothetical protein
MAMKHCTKIQVSLISHKEGEVSISYFMHTLHSSWIHHNSKKIESSCPKNMHMYKWQMKHCTKSYKRRSKHQLFHTLHPFGSTTIQKNNWTKFQGSPIGHLWKKSNRSYFTPSTPLRFTITHNWILPSWQYTHLQMKMTLHKVSSIHSSIYKDRWTQDILHLSPLLDPP